MKLIFLCFHFFKYEKQPSPHIIKLSKKELEDPLVLEDRILSEVSPGTILRIESVQLLSPEELYILSPYLNIKSVSKYYDINGAVSFKDVHFLMLWERKDEDVNKVFQMRHHLVYHRVSKIVNLDEYLPENF